VAPHPWQQRTVREVSRLAEQGAGKATVGLYHEMRASDECRHPLAWSAPDFSLDPFDCVYLPGGHERGVRQIIDSPAVHRLIAAYVPKCRKPGRKAVVAVCHGVMVLSESKGGDGKSAIHECTTTTLPAGFERVAFWGTRWFLGSYYKTYGPNSPSKFSPTLRSFFFFPPWSRGNAEAPLWCSESRSQIIANSVC